MAEVYEPFRKYDTEYNGPPDRRARQLIRYTTRQGGNLSERDLANAELLEYYADRGYTADPTRARAVALHLRRKIQWRAGTMTEKMVYEPLREAGLI